MDFNEIKTKLSSIFALFILYALIHNFFSNMNNSSNSLYSKFERKKHKGFLPLEASKKKYYETFIKNLHKYNHSHKVSNKIFWCWLQGFDKAPEISKASFRSIQKNCNNHNIIIINETNFNKYVKMPSYIISKFKNNTFSKTHFSDLLRLELLIKYGGTWIDSTVLMTKYEPLFFYQDLFFFEIKNKSVIFGSSWMITSEKESPVLKTARDLLYEFWRRENFLCNYFLLHIFFNMAYKIYKKDYTKIPKFSRNPPHFLQAKLLDKFQKEKYQDILKRSSIHKLSYKIANKAKNKKGLFLDYIIKEYGGKTN